MKLIKLILTGIIAMGLVLPMQAFPNDDQSFITEGKSIVAPGKNIREDPERLTAPFYACPTPDFNNRPEFGDQNQLMKPSFAKKPSIVIIVLSLVRKGLPLP